MNRILHCILISISIFLSGVALSQSKGGTAPKTSEETLVAKNKAENVLFSNEDFQVRNVYPNPANESVKLDYSISSHITNLRFEIRNILGTKVGSYYLTPGTNEGIIISTNNLDPGIYFHSLYLGNKNLVTKKLIIKR